MSKSIGNTVDLMEEPNQMFGKLMSIPDHLILTYLQYAAFVAYDELERFKNDLENGVNPRDIKLTMAQKIVDIWHSDNAGTKARTSSYQSSPNMPSRQTLTRLLFPRLTTLSSSQAVQKLGMAPSGSEARRLVQSNAVSIDEVIITDPMMQVNEPEAPTVLRVGKRRFVRLLKPQK